MINDEDFRAAVVRLYADSYHVWRSRSADFEGIEEQSA
jgi:hypothetical protein